MSKVSVVQLAHDVLNETLHGPVPMRTVARLAEGVIAAEARIVKLEGRLQDAIGALRHAAHPVASQWIPVLEAALTAPEPPPDDS